MNTGIALGAGGEFDRIRAIATALGPLAAPLGDDVAGIPAGEGALVASVDATVEGVHFRPGWLTHREIGWRATASALSDLAAAGATPVGVLVAIVAPSDAGEAALVDLMHGVGAAVGSVGGQVLGGDLNAGAAWTVAVTVFGRALRPMSRCGARAGDGVWVTGTLGGARAALETWRAGGEPDAGARAAFAHPLPRIAPGRWLAAHGATAMMDISDGLGGDAAHLAAASGVMIELELERLPLHPAVPIVARVLGEPPERFAATGGEDYELLVTLPAAFGRAMTFASEYGMALTRIGRVLAGQGVRALLDGREVPLHGFRHPL